jgi:hypothetical protein
VRNGIFLKLLAAFLVVILAAAVMFDLMLGGAWQASLRSEIERNLVRYWHSISLRGGPHLRRRCPPGLSPL